MISAAPRRPSPVRTLALFLLAALAAGCATTAGSHSVRAGDPLRVTLHLYRQGHSFELVNESHTPAAELYSDKYAGRNIKVATDAQMVALIEQLQGFGFGEHEEPGPAPRLGAQYINALEIETPAGVTHWGNTRSSPPAVQEGMQLAYREYLRLFNGIAALQAVENDEGGAYFKPLSREDFLQIGNGR